MKNWKFWKLWQREKQSVEVGRCSVVVRWGRRSYVCREFVGFAFWSGDIFGVYICSAEERAKEWIEQCGKRGVTETLDGEFVPTKRIHSFKITDKWPHRVLV